MSLQCEWRTEMGHMRPMRSVTDLPTDARPVARDSAGTLMTFKAKHAQIRAAMLAS
jgi:hypothetical protein